MTENSTLNLSIQVFETVRTSVLLFVPFAFLVRAVFLNLTASQVSQYGGLLKGLVTFFILIFGYELILRMIFSLADAVPPRSNLITDPMAFKLESNGSFIGSIPDVVRNIIETLLATLYYLSRSILHVLFVVLSAVGPIIIFLACLFGIGPGLGLFFGILVLTGTIPIIWYGLDMLGETLVVASGGEFQNYVNQCLILSAKVLAPLLTLFAGINSLPVKQAMSSFVSGGKSFVSNSKSAKSAASKPIAAIAKQTNIPAKINRAKKEISQKKDLALRKVGVKKGLPEAYNGVC